MLSHSIRMDCACMCKIVPYAVQSCAGCRALMIWLCSRASNGSQVFRGRQQPHRQRCYLWCAQDWALSSTKCTSMQQLRLHALHMVVTATYTTIAACLHTYLA